MPRKWRIKYAGAVYHLTARGNGRKAVFLGEEDYERFLEQLDGALEADRVRLYAYVLMPNHYHLFVETPNGNVSRFMQRLNTAYGMYFRYKRKRPGHCFQGRYGATVVGGDGYPLRLTRYIHLNPVWTKAVQAQPVEERLRVLSGFRWSSYRGYAGLVKPEERIDYQFLGEMDRLTDAGRRAAYRSYAESMVGAEDEVLLAARQRSGYALGDERFIEEAEDDLNQAKLRKAIKGDVAWPVGTRPDLDETIVSICGRLKLETEDLRGHGRLLGIKKGLALEAICRTSGASQRAVAGRLGLKNESMVGHQRRLLARNMMNNPSLQRELSRLLHANHKRQV